MFNIIKISDVDSTNNYALSMQKEKFFKEGLVVVSDFQKKGRGAYGAAHRIKCYNEATQHMNKRKNQF